MNTSANNDQLLLKYAYQELTQEEKLKFDKMVNDSKGFRNEVEEMDGILAAVYARERAKEFKRVKDLFTRWDQETNNDKKQIPRYRRMAVAASIIFLMAFGYLYITPSTGEHEAIFLSYYSPYPLTENNRSDVEIERQSIALYSQKKYKEAIPLLEQVITFNDGYTFSIALANAYLQTNEAEKAKGLLYKAAQTEHKPFIAREILWYYHLALLKNNELTAAKEGFRKMVEETGAYQEEAKLILKALDSL